MHAGVVVGASGSQLIGHAFDPPVAALLRNIGQLSLDPPGLLNRVLALAGVEAGKSPLLGGR